ncbi:MAG: LCP family protein [Bacilli bacterium]|nr:LCP family protein [Bacilli bacterium]
MKKTLNFMPKLLGIILSIITLLFIISLFKINILNMKYLLLITITLIVITFIIIFKLFRKKTRKFSKIIFSCLSLILIITYFLGFSYINNTTNFIKNVTTKDNKEYKTYNVITLKLNNYNKINDLKNKKISFLSDNYNTQKETLNKKINFESNNYDNITYLTNSLIKKESDAIVIEENYLNILEEENQDYLKDKKIIYTFKIGQNNKIKNNNLNINKPYIIYISGSDSRSGIKTVARSDVNIIVVVNPKKNKILMVSTPRDYYVQLHGTTGYKDKLTHAGVYGINMSVNTMQDLLNIKIDRYIKVCFTTVINVVDVINGIDIYSDKAFTARHPNRECKFVKGTQHVNGKCALGFSRERYAYSSGDRHRGENQEQVLTKIIEKISSPNYITKYNDILKAIDGSFETNANFEEITSILKKQIDDPKKWEIETYNLDGQSTMGPTYTKVNEQNHIHIMVPYQNTIDKAKQKIKEYLNS